MTKFSKISKVCKISKVSQDKLVKSHIARPPNCFMIWSSEMRKNIFKSQHNENNAELSKILGHMWTSMSSECKLEYRLKADKVKYEHKLLYPDYKYIPKTHTNKKTSVKTKTAVKSLSIKTIKWKKLSKPSKLNNKLIIDLTTNFNIFNIEPNTDFLIKEPDYYNEVELFYKNIM
jgi:hypothetical protein